MGCAFFEGSTKRSKREGSGFRHGIYELAIAPMRCSSRLPKSFPLIIAMLKTVPSCVAPAAFESIELDIPRAAAAGVTLLRVTFGFGVSLDDAAFAALSDDERARAARFLRHEDAIRHAATRAALRNAIGARIGVLPEHVGFRYDPAGRPHVEEAPVGFDFNVSHSGDFALIALAHARRVGVDIESKRALRDWQGMAKTVFAPREHAFFAGLPASEQLDAFFDVWTAKEALLKAIGVGIAGGLDRFSVMGGGERNRVPFVQLADPSAPTPLPVLDYEAYWCEAPSGYAACVAWSKAVAAPQHR